MEWCTPESLPKMPLLKHNNPNGSRGCMELAAPEAEPAPQPAVQTGIPR